LPQTIRQECIEEYPSTEQRTSLALLGLIEEYFPPLEDTRSAMGRPTKRLAQLHLDVTDRGIPVWAVVTGANVHDSQVAIPMGKWTERKRNTAGFHARPAGTFQGQIGG